MVLSEAVVVIPDVVVVVVGAGVVVVVAVAVAVEIVAVVFAVWFEPGRWRNTITSLMHLACPPI